MSLNHQVHKVGLARLPHSRNRILLGHQVSATYTVAALTQRGLQAADRPLSTPGAQTGPAGHNGREAACGA